MIRNDIVKASEARIILPDRIRANKTGSLSVFQVIMGAAKPVHTIVRPPINIRVLGSNFVDIGAAEFLLNFIFTLVRRITDEGINLWPILKQRITTDKVIV